MEYRIATRKPLELARPLVVTCNVDKKCYPVVNKYAAGDEVICYDLWMLSIFFLLNKCSAPGGGKRMQLLPQI